MKTIPRAARARDAERRSPTVTRRDLDGTDRRGFLRTIAAALTLVPVLFSWLFAPARATGATRSLSRIRPGDAAWPSAASWTRLSESVGGRLVEVRSPLAVCVDAPSSTACAHLFQELKNPYFLGDEVGLTQTLGWVDAWTSQPSVYAVAAQTTNDVVAAVNFARKNNLRLVVKGGGHSYQGTSNAADSLLIWTRGMQAITLHSEFIGEGCAGQYLAQPAVTIEAGAIWGHVYDAVLTKSGRYVQGGGCMTVGVAGLIQSGLRKLFQSLRSGGSGPTGSRDRHGGRRGEDRQCLHESGPVLGDQRWRWRQPRSGHPADLTNARSSGILRRGIHND